MEGAVVGRLELDHERERELDRLLVPPLASAAATMITAITSIVTTLMILAAILVFTLPVKHTAELWLGSNRRFSA